VTLLIAQGAHPKAIQAHLGHSSIQVTMNRYAAQTDPSRTQRHDEVVKLPARQAQSRALSCGVGVG
jgi:integrase